MSVNYQYLVLLIVWFSKMVSSGELCLDCLSNASTNSCAFLSCGNSSCHKKIVFDLEAIEKRIETPRVVCRDDTSLTLTWHQTKTTYYTGIYAIKGRSEYHFSKIITSCNSLTLSNLVYANQYDIVLLGFNPRNKTLYKSDQLTVSSASDKRTPVKSLNYSLRLEDNVYYAIVLWEPGPDLSCYYEIVWYGKQEPGDYVNRRINLKKQLKREFNLTNLEFGKNYHFGIMSISSNGKTESPKKWLKIVVPGCLDTFRNLSVCPPGKPKNLTGIILSNARKNSTLTDIKMSWNLPPLLPDLYILDLISYDPQGNQSNRVSYNVSGDKNYSMLKDVNLTSHHMVKLTALSKGGVSSPTYFKYSPRATTTQNKPHERNASGETTNSWIWMSISVFVVLTLCLLLFFCRNWIFKGFLVTKRTENNIIKYTATDPEDSKWELTESKLIIDKAIGFGAFGIVQKGYYCVEPNKKRPVAIKTLKANPSQEQIVQFYDEIEIMKSVPYHAHIVFLVGVVTKSRPSNPLMLVEYCAKGDLQSFLRKVALVLVDSRPDPPKENMDEFFNQSYDLEETFVLKPEDILSFARQIVLGMEFLSNLKVIHRDLAARNVLITEDNILKISDFGLSRDIYTDNIYRKITGGKLPFRWMALESLTHQIYTTESDVWSFGIVLWEIVTLGGNPYPAINTEELVPLLKSGYRMEKPTNCSEEMYQIMLSCWQTSPNFRPNFTKLREIFDKLLESKMQYVSLEVSNCYENLENNLLKNISDATRIWSVPVSYGVKRILSYRLKSAH